MINKITTKHFKIRLYEPNVSIRCSKDDINKSCPLKIDSLASSDHSHNSEKTTSFGYKIQKQYKII